MERVRPLHSSDLWQNSRTRGPATHRLSRFAQGRGKRMRRVLTAATLGGVILFAASAGAQTAPANAPTFSKDIAPIFQAKCQECHQPNSIAPMSLVTFAEARPWARSIKQRVAQRQMPPWHIDQSVGVQKFKNDMSLSQKQIDTIVAWVDAGAPQGDAEGPAARRRRSTPTTNGKACRTASAARPRRPQLRIQDAGVGPGRVVPADEREHPDHRAALGEDGRDSSDQPQGAQGACITRSRIRC